MDRLLMQLGNASKAIPYYALMKPGVKPAKANVHFDGVYYTPNSFLKKLKNASAIQHAASAESPMPDQADSPADQQPEPKQPAAVEDDTVLMEFGTDTDGNDSAQIGEMEEGGMPVPE